MNRAYLHYLIINWITEHLTRWEFVSNFSWRFFIFRFEWIKLNLVFVILQSEFFFEYILSDYVSYTL